MRTNRKRAIVDRKNGSVLCAGLTLATLKWSQEFAAQVLGAKVLVAGGIFDLQTGKVEAVEIG